MARLLTRLVFALLWLVTLGGCQPLPPQYVMPPRRVEPLVPSPEVREVTRVVARVITATPPPNRTRAVEGPLVMNLAPAAATDETTALLAGQLQEWLRGRLAYDLQVVVPTDYQQSIEGLCRGEVDVAWLATPAYLLASERCGAEATLTVLRNGLSFYRGEWLVGEDAWRSERGLAPVGALSDLAGKKVAFTEPTSPTGHLFPRAMLVQQGIVPEEQILVGGDAQAVLAVYRGEVDAAATFWAPTTARGEVGDARSELLTSLPDVTTRVKILQLTEPIPNDPLVLRRDLSREARAALIAALVELARSADGRALLGELYGISGLAPIDDAAYDVVREMVGALGLSADALLANQVPAP